MIDRDLRLRRIKRRLVLQVRPCTPLQCSFSCILVSPPGPDLHRRLDPHCRSAGRPQLLPAADRRMVELDNGPPRRVRHVGFRPTKTSRKSPENWLPAKLIEADIKDSKPYIDVMHEQIGDSLTESEREVIVVIEQINS